jgi:hypothetical protein
MRRDLDEILSCGAEAEVHELLSIRREDGKL